MSVVCNIQQCGCKMAIPINYKPNCAICDKHISHETFLKIPLDDNNPPGYHFQDPVYWANKSFFPELQEDIIFCGPTDSLKWYQKQIDLKT